MRDVNSDQQWRQGLAYRTNGIDEAGGTSMQFIGYRIENGHPGHENVGSMDKDAHQRNGKRQTSGTAARQHGVNQAEKREREEHARAERHTSLFEVALNSVRRAKWAEEAKKFEIGGHVHCGGGSVAEVRDQVVWEPEKK